MAKIDINEREELVDVTEASTEQGEHTVHQLETVSKAKPTGHKWYQKGTQLICDGDHEHYRHGINLPPELVFLREAADGSLVFRNVVTGEEGGMGITA